MSPEVVIECNQCNYKDKVKFPDFPENERLFAPNEVDYETSQKITKHHFDTGIEIGTNNRHYGHTVYTLRLDDKIVGTLSWKWGYLRFAPHWKKD